MASISIVRPAGTPSRIVTSAWPCDSPAVKKRSIRDSFYPKKLPRPSSDPACSRAIRAGRCFAKTTTTSGGGMHLVADRFASDDNGDAVDLATGARVLLTAGSAGGVSEQLRWNERCDALHALRHRAIARLVDFGLVGECSRFEAWACGRPWRGSADEARIVHARATRVLHAMCVSVGTYARDCVKTASDGMGTWVPDAGSGYPAAGPETHAGICRCAILACRGSAERS